MLLTLAVSAAAVRRRRVRGAAGLCLLALVVSVVLLGSPGLSGAAAEVTQDPPSDGRFFEPVFDEMESTEGIVYGEAVFSNGELDDLHLDIFEPAGDTAAKRPLIVLLHGGYFVVGDYRDATYGGGPEVARAFVERGYVVASVQYRLRPELGLPPTDRAALEAAAADAGEDLNAAITWLRDNAADYRIDPDAMVPYGFSAGGILGWSLAWMPGSGIDAPEVAAAVSVAGSPYATSTTGEAVVAEPSAGDAPVLDYHGDLDVIVPYADAAGPCAEAAAVDVRCELVTFAGVGHPLYDSAFVPLYEANAHLALEFIGEEVLAPLGYIDEVPSTGPPDSPDSPPVTDPASPVDPADGAESDPPAARPASAVPGDPTYTG